MGSEERVTGRGAGSWALAGWMAVAVAPVILLWSALTTLAGVLPARAGLAIGAGFAGVVFGGLLVRLALALPHGPCRGAGFLGMAVLTGGAGPVAVALAPAAWAVRALVAGYLVSGACYLLGMLLLPGTAPHWRARLRRLLDGLGMGSCLFFAAWMLVIVPLAGRGPGPAGPRATTVILVWLALAAAVATVVLLVVRAYRYRRAAVICGFGTGLGLVGQAVLVSALLVRGSPAVSVVAMVLTVAGPVLAWCGARRAGVRMELPHPAEVDGTFAGLPLLSVPIALAMVGVVYHLATIGSFGAYSALLGVVVLLAIAAREAFAVLDVRRYASELAGQEARFRSMVSGSTDVTIVLDADLVVRWQSPSAARQLGLSDADVLARPFTALLHPEDEPLAAEQLRRVLADPAGAPAVLAARVRDGFGGYRHTESTVADHRCEPAINGLVVHLRDIGDRREMQRALSRMAYADQLTGLPNRRALLRALAGRDGDRSGGCVLVLGLDGLPSINDGHGREAGDAVLIEVGRRLRTLVPPDHLVARLGGGEFGLLSPGSPMAAHALATRVLTALAEPCVVDGSRLLVSASVGIAELSAGATAEELLAGADLAVRRARRQGRNRIVRYDASLELAMIRRDLLERELRGADRRGELDLVYQPVVTVAGRRTVGVEALLRWRHPKLGTVPPAEFVPIAEAAGLIEPVGNWALHQACRRLVRWLDAGRDIRVSVNLSGRQLGAPDFLAEVAGILDAHQVPPGRLVAEVAEDVVTDDVQRAVNQLAGLRSLGVRTAIDGFGSGHTALTYLPRLPVDVLKADRSLVGEPAAGGRPAAPLADVVVRLGRRLGLRVVAEGVETEQQLELLRSAGCEFAQGFLFTRPLPVEHVEAFMDGHAGGAPYDTGPMVAGA